MRDPNMPYVSVLPILDRIRIFPDFRNLLRRMILPRKVGQKMFSEKPNIMLTIIDVMN